MVKGDLLAVNRNDTILISLGHFSIFTHFFGYAEIDQENLNFNGKKTFILEFHREFQSSLLMAPTHFIRVKNFTFKGNYLIY